jgi:DNA-binding CsgD family transcriptional regulator
VPLCYPGTGDVAEATVDLDARIVGRDSELAVLGEFVGSSESRRALVLAGGPGIGKTTLWEAGVELARRRGLRVLSARASGAETQLAFAALTDVLDGVDSEELSALPPPQLLALEVALLRAEPTGDGPPPTAVSVGFLNALRTLAARQPLLLALDDVQWLDAASAEAVAFAVRRLDGHDVRLLAAKRSGSGSLLEHAYGPKGLQRIEVRALSIGATQRLLVERLGLRLPRHVLRRIVASTLGNPLFALELGRTLLDRGPMGLGEDVPLPDTVEELLGTRVATLPDTVRTLVLAVALSGDLRTWQVAAIAAPGALDEAVELGVLVVDGDRLRPAHPLFATAAKSRARPSERRELHAALAALTTDEEARALHLAFAAEGPDDEVADVLARSAADAAARGARHDAVVLAKHALRLTAEGAAERIDRVLALGEYLEAAGDGQGITDLLIPELDSVPRGRARARALLLLTNSVVDSNDDIRRYLDEALAESADDPSLRAFALLEIAENDAVIRVQRIPAAEAWALEALPTARAAGVDLERRALYALAWPRALRGRSIDDLCERFRSASDAAWRVGISPDRVAAQRLVWRGEVVQARATLAELLALADDQGESYSYLLQRLHMCQLELRIGDCEATVRLLDEWAQSSERMMWPMYERCRALLGAARGVPDDAERWAAETLARAQATGTGWDRLEALRARGTAALLAHDPARAAASLRTVWEHTRREGVDEPGVFPVAPDLVEALVELAETDEARSVTDRLEELARQQQHPWGLATAKRCDAVVRLAADPNGEEDAATGLAEAADAYGELGLPFDRARSLLTLGRARRRLRKWATARASLEEAAAEFDQLGATGWREEARSEQERVGGRRPQASGDLTPSEQRVVELAADGLSNKEIAQTLFVSVRTVEVHLKHAYAKLGVRSRAQLARHLANRS